MRLALVSFQPLPTDWQAGAHSDPDMEQCRRWQVEMEQCMAIARHMRDGGKLAPFLICRSGSLVEQNARELELPHLALSSPTNITGLFRLWLWQKKHPDLDILAIGSSSVKLGGKILSMRKKNSGQLNLAFFLRPPKKEDCGKILERAAHFICGSAFVRDRLIKSVSSLEKDCDKFLECAPGINLSAYNFPPQQYPDNTSGSHFVFGMSESLAPRSGALLVVRAMAAIWQAVDLPSWEVRMFGSGPRFEEVLDEAKKLGVASRLSILADQPLPQVIRQCHVWIAPGISPEELPETLWAGFAARLPVICTQSGLHRERLALEKGNAALRVAENNPQEMARAMLGNMRDARLRHKMIVAGSELYPSIGLEAMADRLCASLEDWGTEKNMSQSPAKDV